MMAAAIAPCRGEPAAQGLDQLHHHRRRGRPGRQWHRRPDRVDARGRRAARSSAFSASRRIPTRMGEAIKIGRRGSLNGRLDVRGVQGHVAYPNPTRNPLTGLIAALKRIVDEQLDDGSDKFLPVQSGNHQHRHRQSDRQCRPSRSQRAVQCPLQRSAQCRLAVGAAARADRGDAGGQAGLAAISASSPMRMRS